jgi:hypothetical protein
MVYSQASIICVTSFSIICPLYMVVFHFISYLLPDIRIWDWIDEQLEYKDCHLLQAYFSLGSLYGFFVKLSTEPFIWLRKQSGICL